MGDGEISEWGFCHHPIILEGNYYVLGSLYTVISFSECFCRPGLPSMQIYMRKLSIGSVCDLSLNLGFAAHSINIFNII